MFKPIRCNTDKETPYLRKYLPLIKDKSGLLVDLGCGNLRNSNYAKSIGFTNILSYDLAGDFGIQIDLSKDVIDLDSNSATVIICNYLLCFFNNKERKHLIKEIERIAGNGCLLFVEMFPAKESVPYDMGDVLNNFNDVWNTKNISKHRFIIQKVK